MDLSLDDRPVEYGWQLCPQGRLRQSKWPDTKYFLRAHEVEPCFPGHCHLTLLFRDCSRDLTIFTATTGQQSTVVGRFQQQHWWIPTEGHAHQVSLTRISQCAALDFLGVRLYCRAEARAGCHTTVSRAVAPLMACLS